MSILNLMFCMFQEMYKESIKLPYTSPVVLLFLEVKFRNGLVIRVCGL